MGKELEDYGDEFLKWLGLDTDRVRTNGKASYHMTITRDINNTYNPYRVTIEISLPKMPDLADTLLKRDE